MPKMASVWKFFVSIPQILVCSPLVPATLAITTALHSDSARFVVMSRLQEMQHYICLQPTGTRTRSCLVIKEWYPERVRVCGSPPWVWQWFSQYRWTKLGNKSCFLTTVKVTDSKFKGTKLGSLLSTELVSMWACAMWNMPLVNLWLPCVWLRVADLTHNPSAPS